MSTNEKYEKTSMKTRKVPYSTSPTYLTISGVNKILKMAPIPTLALLAIKFFTEARLLIESYFFPLQTSHLI